MLAHLFQTFYPIQSDSSSSFKVTLRTHFILLTIFSICIWTVFLKCALNMEKMSGDQCLNLPSQAEQMIDEVKAAFKNNLPHLQWMDAKTRKAAIEKANAVVDMIGFPKYILNITKLDEEYQKVRHLSHSSFTSRSVPVSCAALSCCHCLFQCVLPEPLPLKLQSFFKPENHHKNRKLLNHMEVVVS